DIPGTASRISTTFRDLAREVTPGFRILLSDGLIELRVTKVNGEDIECEVVNGGMLGEHKGINLPGAALSIPALTDKDRRDLEFGLKQGVDMVALSFVRSAADVNTAKHLIREQGSDVPVIAKLEKPQALEHLEAIFEAADGVMIARGDLGVEMPPEKVPVIQKHVIRRASEWRKPVITATQMLESMIENPRPTRAEASDVANAIFDGSDAVMLSAESITASLPSKIALATSLASARVGRGFSIMDSSIWVAVMTGLRHSEARRITCFWITGTFSGGISTPRSPRAIMTPSAASKIASRCSSACGFSSLAMTGTSLPCSRIRCFAVLTSAAERTNESATMSTPCFSPNSRSLRSLSVSAGILSAAPGRLIPLCSPSIPPFTTSHSMSSPFTFVTRSSISPSESRMRKPGVTSRARS